MLCDRDVELYIDTGQEKAMIKCLMRFLGIIADDREDTELDNFEPIYGLPKRSLDEWLSQNPALKKDYEAELRARSLHRRSVRS